MKIGLLGGTFDPVHFGHLIAAQDAFEKHGLDRLILIPAAHAPLKPSEPEIGAEHRVAMLKCAVDGDPRWEVSDVEVQRGGVNYTIDTIRHFRRAYPNDDLCWIIGGDQLAKLPLWRDIAELARLVEFVCLERPGYREVAVPAIPGLRVARYEGHVFGVSSTELRQRARRGERLDYFIPHNAVVYIQEHALYRDET